MFKGKLKVYSEPDTGIYNAKNKGIRKCKGDIIGIINSDDYYSSNTLKEVAQKYEQEKYGLIVINGDMVRVSSGGKPIYRYRFTEEDIKKKRCFGHPSMFAAKSVYDRIGLYDETYKFAADGDWQYRAHEDPSVRYVLCNKVFNHMREGGASDNPKYRWKWFKERSRMKLSHKRGNRFSIYWQEFKSVIRTDIKMIVPKKYSKILYDVKRLSMNTKKQMLNKACRKPLKTCRLLLSMVINYISFKTKGIKMKGVPRFDGLVLISKAPNSTIEIGKNVCLNSGRRCNPVGFENRMMLSTAKNSVLKIGNDVGASNTVIYASNNITIEDKVLLGNGVKIYDTDFHSLNANNRKNNCSDNDTKNKPVVIKKGAFIGAGSTILKGVTIGKESIIGACSVVSKDIPDGQIWAGNPAKFIKFVK